MRIALLVFMLGLAAGCTAPRQVTLPSGDQAYVISCDSGSQDIGDCYNKAKGLCHGPYDVVDRTEGSQVSYSASPFRSAGGVMPRRDITVECGS